MRNTATITVTDAGRDQGKIFHLREWPASRAENWGNRALVAIANATLGGAQVAPQPERSGMLGVAAMGGVPIMARINSFEVIGLLDELMDCVRIQRDVSRPDLIFEPIEEDIEEVATRYKLKMEVFALHTGFTMADIQSRLISWMKSAILSNTQTSPDPSAQSSQAGSPPLQS